VKQDYSIILMEVFEISFPHKDNPDGHLAFGKAYFCCNCLQRMKVNVF
jgi:hypothetical protein